MQVHAQPAEPLFVGHPGERLRAGGHGGQRVARQLQGRGVARLFEAGPRFLQHGPHVGQVVGHRREPRRGRVHGEDRRLVARLQGVELLERPVARRLPAAGRLHAHGVVHRDDQRAALRGGGVRPERPRKRRREHADDQAAQQQRQPAPELVAARVAQGRHPEEPQRRERHDRLRAAAQKMQRQRQADQQAAREKAGEKPVHRRRSRWAR